MIFNFISIIAGIVCWVYMLSYSLSLFKKKYKTIYFNKYEFVLYALICSVLFAGVINVIIWTLNSI